MQVKDFNRCINKLASIHFTPSGHSCEHSQPPKVTMSLLTRKLDENICTEQQKPITIGKKKKTQKIPQSPPSGIHFCSYNNIYLFQFSGNRDGPRNIAALHYPKDWKLMLTWCTWLPFKQSAPKKIPLRDCGRSEILQRRLQTPAEYRSREFIKTRKNSSCLTGHLP